MGLLAVGLVGGGSGGGVPAEGIGDQAGDLIKDITRLYNRTRQANITKEISELIGGAEALK